MTNKPIKEYEDFAGEAGYLIVDSLTNETSGGKLKVPNYKDVTDGYVLTKTSNSGTDEVVWAQVESSGITNAVSPLIIPAGYNDKIELQYDSDTLDVNASNQLTVKDPIPDTSIANNGDVLTVDTNGDIGWAAPQTELPSYSHVDRGKVLTISDSDTVVWQTPQGGGGGGGDVVILELTVQDISSEWHLTAASLTPQEIISNVQAGKLVIARVIKTNNNVTTNIIEVPFGEYYNGSPYGDGYALWFSPFGSGGGSGEHNVWIGTMRGGLQWDSDLWEHSDIDES